MIVVRLMGGLGNQMFQYALGRRLALERGVPLRVDLGWFAEVHERGVDTVREYMLEGWRVAAQAASAEDLARFDTAALSAGRVGRLLRRILPAWQSAAVIYERGPAFDPRALRTKASAYLHGFWQSERYFDSIAPALRAEFVLAEPACAYIAELVEYAADPSTVSLHVRRGDYAHNPATHAFHGLCSPEYYAAAAALVAAKVPSPRFLVFSDEPDWAREHLRLGWPARVVEHAPGSSPHQEMWLMSRCAHHVIANSSFSWWGAWLRPAPGKTVVAPRRWFRDPSLDSPDRLPGTWLRA
jgi:hypothetical protein